MMLLLKNEVENRSIALLNNEGTGVQRIRAV